MPTGPGLFRNIKHLEGGAVASLVLTLVLPTPPGKTCTVVYDCGVTAKDAGDVDIIAIKQGTPFLARDVGPNVDPDIDEVRMALNTTTIPNTPPWLAFGAPNTALSIVVTFLTSLTSGTIFCVFEEVPVT